MWGIIATRYGLDGPGIKFPWGRNFPHPSKPALGTIYPPIQLYCGKRFVPGGKADGERRYQPPPSSVEVTDTKLHLYCPFVPSWQVVEWTSLSLYLRTTGLCTPRKIQICTLSPVSLHHSSNLHIRISINKIQQDATICRYLFTEKSLYMFRMSIAPIIRST